MNSIPAASAICARAKQSGQLPDQRSGTIVTARPEEQLAPNSPSFSRFVLYIAARSPCPILRSIGFPAEPLTLSLSPHAGRGERGCNADANPRRDQRVGRKSEAHSAGDRVVGRRNTLRSSALRLIGGTGVCETTPSGG